MVKNEMYNLDKLDRELLVIYVNDYEWEERDVLGVADSLEKAEEMIEGYYGNYKYITLSYYDKSERIVKYRQGIQIWCDEKKMIKAIITLEWFYLNEL